MFNSPGGHLWISVTRRSLSVFWKQRKLVQKNPSLSNAQASASSSRRLGKLQDALETYQPNTPRITDIVMGIEDRGAVIEHGRLRITSSELSHRDHKTALVLSGTSRSLTAYDFCRMLELEDNSLKGLEEVLPMRNRRTLERSGSWAFVFISPAYAMEYQQRVDELQKIYSRQVTPTGTILSNMPPAEKSINGRAKHCQLFNHALASTLQNASMAAQLFPFDSKLKLAIGIHRSLCQSKSSGYKFFPVKLHLDHPALPSFDSQYIRELLKLDGIMRGRKWALPETDDAVIQVETTTMSGLSPLDLGGADCHPSVNIAGVWQVNFLTAFDAARFVRVWHRKPLAVFGNISLDKPDIYVKAECIF